MMFVEIPKYNELEHLNMKKEHLKMTSMEMAEYNELEHLNKRRNISK